MATANATNLHKLSDESVNSIDYTNVGTFQFTVPARVFKLSVAVLGAGAGGCGCNPYERSYDFTRGGNGGPGGGLSWANDLPVQPGNTIEIRVGLGGAGGGQPFFFIQQGQDFADGRDGQAGGDSRVRNLTTSAWEIIGGGAPASGGSVRFNWTTGAFVFNLSNHPSSGGSSISGGPGREGKRATTSFNNYNQFFGDIVGSTSSITCFGGGGGGAGGWPQGAGGRGETSTVGQRGQNGNTIPWPYAGPGLGRLAPSTQILRVPGGGGGGGHWQGGGWRTGAQGGDGLVRIMWDRPSVGRSYPNGVFGDFQ